jgi:hypothetical protein
MQKWIVLRVKYIRRHNKEDIMSEEWDEVYITYDPLEAEMIKDLLESGGISVVLRSSKVSPYPVNIGKMGEIKVLVRNADKEIAEKVITGEADNHVSS